ncbi:hypothetical protein QQ045_019795 [Rhodiola kirilowii]
METGVEIPKGVEHVVASKGVDKNKAVVDDDVKEAEKVVVSGEERTAYKGCGSQGWIVKALLKFDRGRIVVMSDAESEAAAIDDRGVLTNKTAKDVGESDPMEEDEELNRVFKEIDEIAQNLQNEAPIDQEDAVTDESLMIAEKDTDEATIPEELEHQVSKGVEAT